MYRQYTKCFIYKEGDEKPYNEKDLVALGLFNVLLLGGTFGALTGVVVGLLVGGPVGAVVGTFVGIFSGVYVGMAMAITDAAERWLNHRLICLGGDVCAIGTVLDSPEDGGLGNFDNDEYFEVVPMPFPIGKRWDYELRGDWQAGKVGTVHGGDEQAQLAAHPRNDLLLGNPQGIALMRPVVAITDKLSYSLTEELYIHCEAEGDFWVRMRDLASALAALAGALAVGTAAAAVGGWMAGAAACAALGLFAWVCFLVALVVAAVAAIIAALASKAIVQAALQGVYDANPGDVEDAHVGDDPKGPIVQGDRVVVFGTHVYDGFHDGWNEIHPLKLVTRVPAEQFLVWTPLGPILKAADPPGLPQAIVDLGPLEDDDYRRGLESDRFAKRVEWVRDEWCGLAHESFSDDVRTRQSTRSQRWTVHPTIDGCRDEPNDPPPLH